MPRWLYALLVLVPLAVLGHYLLNLSPLLVFAASAGGLIPLAGIIGSSTEDLADHLGPRIGGLLNATFGNAAELIITSFAINSGLLTLAKASITGSIIGNTLLVFGAALLAGGIKHGRLHYSARAASADAAMMLLALSGLYLPATFAVTEGDGAELQALSVAVAVVLLLSYAAYLAYTVFGLGGGRRGRRDEEPSPPPGPELIGERPAPVWQALVLLAAATVGAALVSETLVDSVEAVTTQLGWSEFFIGVIVVAIVGNAAEHYSAVKFALGNRVDVSLAVSAGSSTQVALFVAPVVVLLSVLLGHPMTLVFQPLELVVLGLAAATFAYICLDGESNWLEGVQLLSIYAIAALAFYFVPNSEIH